METQTQEAVTTIQNPLPTQVTRTTTVQADPVVKSGTSQKVFDTKKKIFRANQIIWYILGMVEVLLTFRILLKAMGANPYIGFTNLIYTITNPLALPFRGIIGDSISNNTILEWSSVFALLVYLVIAGGLVYLSDLVNPISPEEVATTV